MYENKNEQNTGTKTTKKIGKTTYEVIVHFNDTATTEIYTLSLHDALPIYCERR